MYYQKTHYLFFFFSQLFPRGHICRISQDPCDFTEYCTGTSEFCVDDMKSLDYELCSNKTAFCYKGICRDPSRQCMELFGKFSKGSSYLCAEEINYLGDDFGNCFPNRCVITDTLCAKIVCHWTHTKIASTTSYDIQYTYLGGQICMSASKRSNTPGPDQSFVEDGTICDQNKVCNTNNHCHCDAGFTPPSCELIPSSPGGSIDDGFWLLYEGLFNSSSKFKFPYGSFPFSLKNFLLYFSFLYLSCSDHMFQPLFVFIYLFFKFQPLFVFKMFLECLNS
ncbi:PREDICTED: putative disintegrin and metalloproteinase domain-containing protein 5 isoform X2 [Miniopterus natalensis]|uniref:putative disintegrin and metalloproteinase domain-containing protein 5 isoform X2 n=1 Tax=Miniopterus natalensis TaxID=291302 RepID=UPI0007A7142B|nr:PREDICTED: putative disintegrin and metalloproteinase domain-containing protein 5 isoform X2 [Miniopterus natalensis]